jgi:hypothetical protein
VLAWPERLTAGIRRRSNQRVKCKVNPIRRIIHRWEVFHDSRQSRSSRRLARPVARGGINQAGSHPARTLRSGGGRASRPLRPQRAAPAQEARTFAALPAPVPQRADLRAPGRGGDHRPARPLGGQRRDPGGG